MKSGSKRRRRHNLQTQRNRWMEDAEGSLRRTCVVNSSGTTRRRWDCVVLGFDELQGHLLAWASTPSIVIRRRDRSSFG
ncbi:unnamed protein product [Linum trigynum]|uniref:Uncharacterized protein n=1 Tax=Linum trigynum TaxID=586398 RepID=A0AAV2CTW7_9ROSI